MMHSKTETNLIILLFVALLSPTKAYADTLNTDVQAGVAQYQQHQYNEAAQSFESAYKKQPGNSNLSYNLANSKYKSGKFEEAVGSYSKAMADNNLKHQSLYNTGNALYRMGKLEEAESAYKKALELNPGDMDTKFNLEFTREQIKKKKQPQNQDRQNPDKQNQKSDKPEQGQQSKGSDQQNKDQKKNEPSHNQQQSGQDKRDNKPNENGNQNNSPQPAQLAEMSKEEAEQWLRSLEENPKKFAQRQMQDKFKQENTPVGKDW